MVRDANARRRDALIIPGGIILIYGLAAIVYAEWLRNSSDHCPDGSWVLINGVCYTVWKLVLPLLLAGEAMVLVGAIGLRGKPETAEKYLEHGSGSRFVLAALISLVAMSALGLLIQLQREQRYSTTYVLEAYDVPFRHVFLLALALILSVMALLPYAGLYAANNRRRLVYERVLKDGIAEGAAAEDEEVDEASFDAPEGQEWPEERQEDRCLAMVGSRRCESKTMPGGHYCAVHHR